MPSRFALAALLVLVGCVPTVSTGVDHPARPQAEGAAVVRPSGVLAAEAPIDVVAPLRPEAAGAGHHHHHPRATGGSAP